MTVPLFQPDIAQLIDELHRLSQVSSDLPAFERIRNVLLEQEEAFGLCASALDDVIFAVCDAPRSGPEWARFRRVVNSTSRDNHNERSRKRALATVCALWSMEVVLHYGWERESRAFLTSLRACTRKYPQFTRDFIPQANRIMLDRHEQSLQSNKVLGIGEHHARRLSQSPRSPLSMKDVTTLENESHANATGDYYNRMLGRWTQDCAMCSASIRVGDKTILELRQSRFQDCLLEFDRYGMLVPRTAGVDRDDNDCFSCLRQFFGADLQKSPPSNCLLAARDRDHNSSSLDVFRSTEHPCPSQHAVLHVRRASSNSSSSSGPAQSVQTSSNTTEATTPWSLIDFDPNQSTPDSCTSYSTPSDCGFQLSPPEATSPLLGAESCLSLEQSLRMRYYTQIASYINQVETGEVQNSTPMQSKWLRRDTRMARIFVDPDSNIGYGAASDEANADVLYYSGSRFNADAQAGKAFNKPIVIKERFSDSGLCTPKSYSQLLRDVCTSDLVQVQRMDRIPPQDFNLDDFLEVLQSSNSQPLNSRSLKAAGVSLHLGALARALIPSFTTLNRFRLLHSLIERVRQTPNRNLAYHQDTDRLYFNNISISGAFSPPVVNTLTAAWMRNLFGLKLCTIVPNGEMELDNWEDVASDSVAWDPAGKERLIILEEDDVLFLPAGVSIVYAMHTPQTCLMEGGFAWDSHSIIDTLRRLHVAVMQPPTFDGVDIEQLLSVVTELGSLVRRDWARFAHRQGLLDFQREFDEAMLSLSLRAQNRRSTGSVVGLQRY